VTLTIFSSLTRISDLESAGFETRCLPRQEWAGADYVVGEVTGAPSSLYQIELPSGRVVRVMAGDHVIGAFGNRAATLEGAGCWSDIDNDEMHAMTAAGLFGVFTSMSPLMARPLSLKYLGHVIRNGRKVNMTDFAIKSGPSQFSTPTIVLVGTSMSAGKTTTGRLIVHELANLGLNVVGAKLTGAGRYREILSFRDAGASAIFDFVDAGMPSTVVPEKEFRASIRPLLHEINSSNPDYLIAEAGASPLEPYNGAVAIDELGDNIRCTVLCASDPYAVVGVQQAFGLKPDFVTGPATNTSAAIELVRKLTGVQGANSMDSESLPIIRAMLRRTLGVDFPKAA
jgi:hypothetical protein